MEVQLHSLLIALHGFSNGLLRLGKEIFPAVSIFPTIYHTQTNILILMLPYP